MKTRMCMAGALAGALLLLQCTQMMSDFKRIDDNKLRVIGVQYLPRPDVCPGDTVTARAYFAGNGVTTVNDYTVAYQAYLDEKGGIFIDKPITVVAQRSWLPDSFEVSFVVPDSIFFIERTWYDSAMQDSIAGFMMQPENNVTSALAVMPDSLRSQTLKRIRGLSLWANVRFAAGSENGSALQVRSSFAIRYNTRYPELFAVNNNPRIAWVAVYGVPNAEAIDFDPFLRQPAATVRTWFLYNEQHPDSIDTNIVIDTGYSYFFAADNGVRMPVDGGANDTLWDRDTLYDGTVTYESMSYKWFFQNVDNYAKSADSMLVINDFAENPYVEFKPPILTSVHRFKIWVAAVDRLYGTYGYRPVGVGVKGVQGGFSYTEAYGKSVGE